MTDHRAGDHPAAVPVAGPVARPPALRPAAGTGVVHRGPRRAVATAGCRSTAWWGGGRLTAHGRCAGWWPQQARSGADEEGVGHG